MVNHSPPLLDATFGALADPIRRSILDRLATGQSAVTELAEPFDVSLPAISKHLRVLERAGLIEREKLGRVHYCRLNPGPLRDAAGWIDTYRRYWEFQLGALRDYLEGRGGDSARQGAQTAVPRRVRKR